MISPFSSYCQEREEEDDTRRQGIWEPKVPNVGEAVCHSHPPLKLSVDVDMNLPCLFLAGSGSHHIRHHTPFQGSNHLESNSTATGAISYVTKRYYWLTILHRFP